MRHPDLTPVMDAALRFSQQGMTTIFGLSGAALAFYHTANPERKKMAKAILLPAIITSILTGITEPIEFTFLFFSPLLWVIHATLTAASQALCDLLSVRPWGASGLIEFLIYNLPLPVSLTRWPVYILIGVGQFAAYYVIFRTLVIRLKLKTPGREDEGEVKLYSKADYHQKQSQAGGAVTDEIIRGLGGKENIISVDNCFTRLRVTLHDPEKIDEPLLKSTGANGVVRNQNELQVIYGVRVGQVKSRVDNWLANN
ncbi:EIICB-Glc [Edwardsiella tarda]|nr:EIICB-Glc [Edwardsiella tarda]